MKNQGWFSLKAFSIVAAMAACMPAQGQIAGFYHGEIGSRTNLVDQYSAWVGREITMAQGHQNKKSWVNDIENDEWQMRSWGNWVKGKSGRVLNYSVSMIPEGASLQTCSTGAYNASFRKLANNMVYHGLRGTIIRLGWEFSGGWFPWSAIGKEAAFVGCWRQIVNTMRSAQPNAGFKFDWNPNWDISSTMMEKTYPGNDYVDFIGIDIYDQGYNGRYPIPSYFTQAQRQARWEENWRVQQGPALTKFKNFLLNKQKLANGAKLRLSIPEWGLNDSGSTGGEDNTVYMRNMLAFIYNKDNQVAYQSYFDFQADDGKHQISDLDDWGGRTFKTAYPNAAAIYKSTIRAGGVTSTPPSTGGTVTGTSLIQTRMNTNLFLDVTQASQSNGTRVGVWTRTGGNNQRFEFLATGQIRVYGFMCLNAASGLGRNGDAIIIWPCATGTIPANEKWTFNSAGELRGINNRCMDVPGTAAGTKLVLWDCKGGINQKFNRVAP